jgi:peptide chain release factor 3
MHESRDRLKAEVSSRRTFAIISHPDAGKTTLTEKLLLYGGAIHLAGAVKARRGGRSTTSDWMELERQRGISVSTSVLQFDYGSRRMNLLDTPGHNDFSEDTYRTLAAADCAVMLLDSAKGVEPQTIKLFQVCRLRGIPIVTFINKLDREGRQPLDLLDEIEKVLGIPCVPMDWPVGQGVDFRGTCDRATGRVHLFERADAGTDRAPMTVLAWGDPRIGERIGAQALERLREDLALLDAAGDTFDVERFLGGRVTPVFFGSALTNFGVEPFLDRFVELAPAPRPRPSSTGEHPADAPGFTGFVFKIQANMDPRHRDRVSFVRVCSGKFTRGMEVFHVRSGKTLTLNRPMRFLAQERVTVDEAYSGDILGLWDPGVLRIGDTLVEGEPLEFEGIPRFSPEHFMRVRMNGTLRRKQLAKGLEELSEEGAVQLFTERDRIASDPVLGAVGLLQFDVLRHRLANEYGVEMDFDPMGYRVARWVEGSGFEAEAIERLGRMKCVLDVEERPVVLFENEWVLRMAQDDFPDLKFVSAVQPGRRR